MTLIPFPPERLDALALRVFDLAAVARNMANRIREEELDGFALHGQKIDEWLGHLEDWMHDGSAKLDTAMIRHRGVKRAQTPPTPVADMKAERRGGGKKAR